jgi:hypothetical protein
VVGVWGNKQAIALKAECVGIKRTQAVLAAREGRLLGGGGI